MDDTGTWQWITGGIAGAWLLIVSFVGKRLHLRLDRLEDEQISTEEINRRFDSLNETVTRHDRRNEEQHGKVFESLTETKVAVARVESKLDALKERAP